MVTGIIGFGIGVVFTIIGGSVFSLHVLNTGKPKTLFKNVVETWTDAGKEHQDQMED